MIALICVISTVLFLLCHLLAMIIHPVGDFWKKRYLCELLDDRVDNLHRTKIAKWVYIIGITQFSGTVFVASFILTIDYDYVWLIQFFMILTAISYIISFYKKRMDIHITLSVMVIIGMSGMFIVYYFFSYSVVSLIFVLFLCVLVVILILAERNKGTELFKFKNVQVASQRLYLIMVFVAFIEFYLNTSYILL